MKKIVYFLLVALCLPIGLMAQSVDDDLYFVPSKDKQEKKETTKSTKKLPMTAKMKRAMAVYIAMVLIMTAGASTVFAADDPLTVINNLSTFIFGLIRAIGMILLGFGIVQVGLSLKSHDPSQRANGFLTLAGGVIITFAKEILNLITGKEE